MSAVLDFPVKPEARDYLACFAADPNEPAWLGERRRQGITRFAELGWPTRRNESWRYFDVSRIDQMRPAKPPAAAGEDAARKRIDAVAFAGAGQRIVLIDGRFAPALSRIESRPGVWLGSTAEAIRKQPESARAVADTTLPHDSEAFDALNAAFFSDGFVLHIGPGIAVEDPIEIVHLATGISEASLHTRSVVALDGGARATIIETYTGDEGRYWRNDLLAVRLGEAAELQRVVLVEEAAEAVHIDGVSASLGAKARFAEFVLLLGGRNVRHETSAILAGDAARCEIDGGFVVSGRDEANIVTTIDHAKPRGETRELVKGVAAGRAHGAFQGRIIVRPDAQKTDAHQLSRNLILGERAVIDTKPELEIYADDVKCSHGASVGDLDAAALFYLRARGIPEAEARRILVEGFVREAVEEIADPDLREHLLQRLQRRLAALEE